MPESNRKSVTLEGAHSKKIAAGWTAVGLSLVGLGWIGTHKFMLGYQSAGLISILLSLLCLPMVLFNILSLVEGIIYLTRSDEVFYQRYILNEKNWF